MLDVRRLTQETRKDSTLSVPVWEWRNITENIQPVSRDVCFKMDPGTSQSLSLLLLCWRCPLQHHRSAPADVRTHTHTYMEECTHADFVERKNHNRAGSGLHTELFPTHSGLQFILHFSSMLLSHDDNARPVVSQSGGFHIQAWQCNHFHRENMHILVSSRYFFFSEAQ